MADPQPIQRCVYIIESPNDIDVLDERCEGLALSKALTLGGIENQHYFVVTENALHRCFHRISEREQKRLEEGRQPALIAFHLSCHANEHEIGLTSDESIPWKDFWTMLRRCCQACGHTLPGGTICLATVTVSACRGFHGLQQASGLDVCPFWSGVGSEGKPQWNDALTFFSVFFHLLMAKGEHFVPAMEKANAAAGLEPDSIFKAVSSTMLGYPMP